MNCAWRDASENDKGVAVEGNKYNSSRVVITIIKVRGDGDLRLREMGDLPLKMGDVLQK
jgi:hypothetical protein